MRHVYDNALGAYGIGGKRYFYDGTTTFRHEVEEMVQESRYLNVLAFDPTIRYSRVFGYICTSTQNGFKSSELMSFRSSNGRIMYRGRASLDLLSPRGTLSGPAWSIKSKHQAYNRACFNIIRQISSLATKPTLDNGDEYVSVEDLRQSMLALVMENNCKVEQQYLTAEIQGDEGVQGEPEQESDKSSTAIITRDQGAIETDIGGIIGKSINATEVSESFSELTARWIPLPVTHVTSAMKEGDNVASYVLPEALFDRGMAHPMLAPLRTYYLGSYDMRVKIVVNGHKMMTGKIVAALLPHVHNNMTINTNYRTLLTRPHVVLDLCTNCEGELSIPFIHSRSMIVNSVQSPLATNRLMSESVLCGLSIEIASPLRVPDGENSEMEVRVFIKLENVKLAGMYSMTKLIKLNKVATSFVNPTFAINNGVVTTTGITTDTEAVVAGVAVYPAPSVEKPSAGGGGGSSTVAPRVFFAEVQMDSMVDAVVGPKTVRAVKELIGGAERALSQYGSSYNQDKPTQLTGMVICPRPQLYFPNSKGLSHATIMRMNPTTITNHATVNKVSTDPKTMLDVARIWGLYDTYEWKNSQKEGTEIFHAYVDPTHRIESVGTPSITPDIRGIPTPVEYVSSMFAFHSGTIEYRLDFVSNSFHTGAIMMTAEYMGPTNTASTLDAYCTYTKTFHLGEQKSVSFVVPYIQRDPWRKSNNCPLRANLLGTANNQMKKLAPTVFHRPGVRFRVTVLNSLHAPNSCVQDIKVMLFMRAGEDYSLHSLVRSAFACDISAATMDGPWPGSLNLTTNLGKGRTVMSSSYGVAHTAPNNRIAFVQGPGDENPDPTANFRAGPGNHNFQSGDCQWDLKDILRRPLLLMDRATVNKCPKSFMIPCSLPHRTTPCLSPYNTEIRNSPHVAISNMFRLWRGSLRFTIVATPMSSTTTMVPVPIYVTYIPYSGVRYMGNIGICGVDSVENQISYPPHGHGLITEMILPSVNPSVTVEIPFEAPFSWAAFGCDNPAATMEPHDQVMDCIGHLMITSAVETAVDVWIAAGDDIELGAFIGIPYCVNTDANYMLIDDECLPPSTELGVLGTTQEFTSNVLTTDQFAALTSANKLLEVNQIRKFALANGTISNGGGILFSTQSNVQQIIYGIISTTLSPYQKALYTKYSSTGPSYGPDTSKKIVYAVTQGPGDEEFYDAVEEQGDTSVFAEPSWFERVSLMANKCAQQVTPTMVARATVASIPVVGPGLVAAHAIDNLTRNVDEITVGATATMQNLNATAISTTSMVDNVNETVSKLSSKLGVAVDSMVGAIDTALAGFSSLANGASSLFEFFLDIVVAIVDGAWLVAAKDTLKFIVKYLGYDLPSACMEYGKQLASYLKMLFTHEPIEQGPNDTVFGAISALVGVVGLMVNSKLEVNKFRSFKDGLCRKVTSTSGVGYIVMVTRYLTGILKTIYGMFMRAIGYVDPEVAALDILQAKSGLVAEFVERAAIVCEANAAMMIDPTFRYKYWEVVMQAYQIRKLLTRVPNNVASPVLARMCGEVIKAGNERFVDLSCSPARYEPLVICIYGESQIGKSFMTSTLAADLLLKIGFTRPIGETVYTRTPGSKFWSGYRDQPIVVYDDWMNLRTPERMEQVISELFALKSTCAFIPEMAHLEDKRIHGNPLVVILLCNEPFPSNLSSIAMDTQAVLRRRDILVEASVIGGFDKRKLRELSEDDSRTLKHLQFNFFTNACQKESRETKDGTMYREGADKSNLRYYDYSSFSERICNHFSRWNSKEMENVRQRVANIQKGLGATVNTLRIEDPFNMFYEAHDTTLALQKGEDWLPYEVLERSIESLRVVFDNYQCTEMVPELQSPGEVVTPHVSVWTIVTHFTPAMVSASSWILDRLANIVSYYTGVKQTCCVCSEEDTPHRVCLSNVPHYMCGKCEEERNRLQQPTGCPYCRGPTKKLTGWDYVNSGTWLGFALLLARKPIKYIMECFKEYGSLLNLGHIAVHLSRVAYALTTGNRQMVADGFADTGLAYGLTVMSATVERFERQRQMDLRGKVQQDNISDLLHSVNDSLRSNIDYPVIQADEPSTSRCVAPNPEIVGSRWCDVVVRRPTASCKHQKVSECVDSIRYRNGIWIGRDLETNEEFEAPDCWCEGECYWAQSKIHQNLFYTGYLGRELSEIQDALIQLKLNPRNREPLGVIPRIFQPLWIDHLMVVGAQTGGFWNDVVDVLIRACSKWKEILVGLIALIGAAKVISKVANYFLPGIEVQDGAISGLTPEERSLRTARNMTRKQGDYFVKVQAGEETSELEHLQKKLNRNYLVFHVHKADKTLHLAGVGLCGNMLLLPQHYVRMLKEAHADKLLIEVSGGVHGQAYKQSLSWDACIVTESPTYDLAVVQMPRSVPIFKDIRKYIAKGEDYTTPLPRTCYIILPPNTANTVFMYDIEIADHLRNGRLIVENKQYGEQDVLAYNFSKKGACGGLVLRPDHVRPIIGMHFAGMPGHIRGEGYSILLLLESFGNIFDSIVPVDTQCGEWEDREGSVWFPGQVQFEGAVKEKTHTPNKTSIVQSMVFDEIAVHTTEPVIQSPHDPRYVGSKTPLIDGVMKHGILTKDFPHECLVEAYTYLKNKYLQYPPLIVNAKKLSVEEACIGIPGVPYYEGMTLSKSAGYPYCTTSRKTKGDYITREPFVMDVELTRLLEANYRVRTQNVAIATKFVDTKKDERKFVEKIGKVGSTRIFCNPPLEYVIAMRQSFLHFCGTFYHNRWHLGHAVGVDANGGDWSHIPNGLSAISHKNVVSLDYSNFGPGFNAQVGLYASKLIKEWTREHVTGVNESEMDCLLYEGNQSMHLVKDTLYRQFSGSPSGSPITVVINTIVNQLYLAVAWLKLYKGTGLVWTEYERLVKSYAYGDDLIMSVDDSCLGMYDGATIQEFFKQYGIVATDAGDKSQKVACGPLEDAVFLQRKFVHHPTRSMMWLAPLNKRKLLDISNWVHKNTSLRRATEENIEMMLILAHAHGRDYFELLYAKTLQVARKRKIKVPPFTWDTIDRVMFDNCGFKSLFEKYNLIT